MREGGLHLASMAPAFSETFLEGQRRGDHAEGSAAQAKFDPVFPDGHRIEIQAPGRAEFLGGEQDAGLLTHVVFGPGKALRSEASQIYLPVLGILDGDPVDIDTRVLAAEAADVDGLHPADPTVILELQAAEHPHDFAQVGRALQQGGRGFLSGGDDASESVARDGGSSQRIGLGQGVRGRKQQAGSAQNHQETVQK